MLNYNQSLSEKKLFQDLQISEITPIMKLIIRGKKREFFSAIGKSLNILLPVESNTSTLSQKLSALWLSPDEWMIFSNETTDKNSNHNETLLRNIRRLFSRFWKCFFLRKGYKEKRIGFTIALVAAIYPLLSFLKYRKLK